MKIRKAGTARRPQRNVRHLASLAISTLGVLVLAGCGAPGEPQPPSPPVPIAVNDLAAHQVGDSAELTFTLPNRTIAGDRLAQRPGVEILRGGLKPDGKPDLTSLRVVAAIPGALIDTYLADDRVTVRDTISPEETKVHPGGGVAYAVRTRASAKRASKNSNVTVVRLYPVPEKIPALAATVTEPAIVLTWQAPEKTSAGEGLPVPLTYHIYRVELTAETGEAAAKDFSQGKWKSTLALLGTSDTTEFRDTNFEFGKVYAYVARSAEVVEGNLIESDDSPPVVAKPVDIFPPGAPRGLVAAVLPGATPGSVQVDLSWSINPETDLAGYYVYRSEQEGTRGTRVTPDLLPTPAVRDTSVEPGHRYWYSVTAVDRAGNESAPSAAAAIDTSQPLP